MIYFVALSAIISLAGLTAAASAQETSLSIFGLALFGFGVLFGLFMVKLHFDSAEGSGRNGGR
jgi:tellurite resistance protein TehA-like permease